MAILLTDRECPACGHRHHFVDPLAADGRAAATYEYHCPRVGRVATLRVDGPAAVVRHGPQGAVHLQRVAA